MLYYYIKMNWKQKGNGIKAIVEVPSTTKFVDVRRSVTLNKNGNILAICEQSNIDSVNTKPTIIVYKWNGSKWNQLGKNIIININVTFTLPIALNDDGTTLAVGMPGNDDGDNAGSVNVYKWDGSSWKQRGNTLNGVNPGDRFGADVKLSSDGNTLATRAPFNDGYLYNKNPNVNRGTGYVYKWDGSSWNKIGLGLRPIGEAIDDNASVINISPDAKILSISSTISNKSKGYVKLFYLNDSTSVWTQIGSTLRGENEGDFFGRNVEIKKINDTKYYVVISTGKSNGKINDQIKFYSLKLTKHKKYPYKLLKNPQYTIDLQDSSNILQVLDNMSVSDDGNIIAISDADFDLGESIFENSGSIKIFEFNSTKNKYIQKGKTLKNISERGRGILYGGFLKLSGNGKVVVGASWIVDSIDTKINDIKVFEYK